MNEPGRLDPGSVWPESRSPWTLVTILLGIGAYVLLRLIRSELVDFEVYRTAAARALAAQPLFRLDDGHYQYKYLPAFAFVMAPFAWLPKALAEAVWFALSVAMAAWFVRMSLLAVPDRRLSDDALIWLALLLMGKFLVKELAFGQTNILLGLVLLGAALAAQRGRHLAAGVLVGVGVFVKPYALVFVPWLMWVSGASALAAFSGVIAVGLLLPAAVYGWAGNLDLLAGWYRIVTGATAHTLLAHENISFASMWAKWWRPEAAPLALDRRVVGGGVRDGRRGGGDAPTGARPRGPRVCGIRPPGAARSRLRAGTTC